MGRLNRPCSNRPAGPAGACVTWLRCLLAVCLFSGSACNNDPVGRTVPVSGKVTVAGRRSRPVRSSSGPTPTRATPGQWRPLLKSPPRGLTSCATRGKEGAPLGWYKVTVTAQEPSNPKDRYSRPRRLVPAAYATKDTTELRIEVVENPAVGAYDLPLP